MQCHKYLQQSLPPQLSILRASRLHHMFLGVMSSLPGRPGCSSRRRSARSPRPAGRPRSGLQRLCCPRHTLCAPRRALCAPTARVHPVPGPKITHSAFNSVAFNPTSFKDHFKGHFSLKRENHP